MSNVNEFCESSVDSVIQDYGINVDATIPIKFKRARMSKGTRVYQVENASVRTYLVDTPMTRRIACHPHVVGKELENLSLEAAENTLPAILELSEVGHHEEIVFEQILRAAPGYKLHEAARKQIYDSFRTVYIRPQYTHTSYREHNGMIQQQLRVVYEDFSDLPKGKEISIIMQDTVASGRSGEIAIKAALDHCERVGSRIKKWILYGFISSRGLKVLEETAKSHGLTLVAFAMGNLTALCSNNYDMPLYGVDESLWKRTHSVQKLGALVDRSTLADYVQEFIPGADQPGDWSARQLKLFTGVGHENGNIRDHLENSARLIESLMTIGNFADWHKKLALEELGRINEELIAVENR
jgi:hypothetical protein